MNILSQNKNGILFTSKIIKTLSFKTLTKLKKLSKHTELQRSRICFHNNNKIKFQEMFISMDNISLIKPSSHNYDETITIINGKCEFFFFNNKGNIIQKLIMGSYKSDLPFIVNIEKNNIHSLDVKTKTLQIFENLYSSFSKKNTFFPKWSDKNQYKYNKSYKNKKIFKPKILKIDNAKYQFKEKIFCINKKMLLNYENKLNHKLKKITLYLNDRNQYLSKQIIFLFKNYIDKKYIKVNIGFSLLIISGSVKIFIKSKRNTYKKIYLSNSTLNEYNNIFLRIEKNYFYKIETITEKAVLQMNTL